MALSKKNLKEIIDKTFEDTFQPSHQLGPDHLIPTDNHRVWTPEEPTRVRVKETGPESRQPISLVTFFQNAVKKNPYAKALAVKRDGQWLEWSYMQYWNESRTTAKAFIKLGLQSYHSVCILGFNSPEWFFSNHAAIMAGGISTGIYPTNSPSACAYVLKHSKSNIVVVDGDHQLKKILEIKHELPHLKAIVQYGGNVIHEDVFSWVDIQKIGESVPDEILERRIKSLAINRCCSTIYTSGTTGTPKAVMLHHDNFLYLNSEFAERDFDLVLSDSNKYSIVSFLPLNHIAAQIMDLYGQIMVGGQVFFAQPDAFKGTLITTLQEACPTTFGGVPRVFEKIKEKLEETIASMNWFTRSIITWAMNNVRTYVKSTLNETPHKPFGYIIANMIIHKIKRKMGLHKVKHFGGGGAPVSVETHDFFMGLGLITVEGYGMSETSGVHVINSQKQYRVQSVGKETNLNELKIINPDADGNGEILMKGRNAFMGYMFDEEKTKETIDADGWVHSGDIGKVDADGFLYITGRIKELIITAGGENIAPAPIEEAVKAELPIISQAVLVGDKQKFLSMLLTLKTNIDMDTLTSLDTLSEVSLSWCRAQGSNANTVDDIVQGSDKKVTSAIQRGIERANQKAISNACKVQKWKILPRDFSIQEDELSPTMKLKRHVIQKKYKDLIDSMYA